MSQQLMAIGIIFVFVGAAIILFAALSGKGGKVDFAVGGFIGPIPFGFANSKPMLFVVMAIMMAVALLFVFSRWV